MTNEVAIHNLFALKLRSKLLSDKEAIALAIKALEQQSCEDCISREAAIEAIYKKYIGGKDAIENAPINDLYAEGLAEAVDAVWDMPSVTPQAEQKAVLGKIRAEIEQLTSRYSISKERGGMGIVEWSDRLIKESDVLQIINKYKAESEDKGW